MVETKKTIFITIGRGIIARNFLNNDFFKKLKEKYKVVILSPLSDNPEFIRSFAGAEVVFVELIKHKISWLELIFISLHKALIYNPTVQLKTRHSIDFKNKQKEGFKKLFKYYFQHIVFGLFLSKIKILREWLRKLDALVYKKNYYQKLFDKFKPSAVFITSISADDEIYFLRAAKKNKILDFGMTKSWDNFSKVGFREKTNNLIVWNEYMKDEAMWFQCYKKEEIVILGVPQFDIYYDVKSRNAREEFIRIYGLNPLKKIILFGQEAPAASPDDPYVIEIIKNWIIKERKDYQILIRPNFGYRNGISCFNYLVDNKVVFIDKINQASKFKDAWDFSFEHLLRLALSMRFPDLVITSTSTLVLDALASDNNVVCYAFDKEKNKPFGESIRRLYGTMWFRDLKKCGLDEIIANDEKELFGIIEEILEKGGQKFFFREKIVKRFCGPLDGKSGLRIFEFIDKKIKEAEKL